MSAHRAHEHDEQHVYDHPEDSAGLALPVGAAPARRVGLRRMLWIAPLAALMLVAVSCGEPAFEAGPLGAVKVAPGEAIQIRAMQVLTGLGDLGTPSQRGVALALEDYGPIKGHGVSLGDDLDSLCTAEGGAAAANEVAGDPQVVGVIGPSCSVAAAAASPILSEAGLVTIAPSTTSPSLTSDLRGNAGANYHEGYYRTANNDLHQARAVARFTYTELGLRKMAAIHDGDPYTTGLTSDIHGRVRAAWRLGHGRLGQQGRHGHVPCPHRDRGRQPGRPVPPTLPGRRRRHRPADRPDRRT